MKNLFSLIAVLLFLTISIAPAAPPGDRQETKIELQKHYDALSDVVMLTSNEILVTDVITTDNDISVSITKSDTFIAQNLISAPAIPEATDIYNKINTYNYQHKQNNVLAFYLCNYL